MTASARPNLEPGKVYRTSDLARWSANPTRLAARLVDQGELVRLRRGLFAAPRASRWGNVPPSDDALLTSFLGGSPYIVTGPPRWNALGLGATAMFAMPLVYNTLRSGVFDLGGRPFLLRRVRFPTNPPPEWFAVDLLMNAEQAGASLTALMGALARAVLAGRLDRARLQQMAKAYATHDIQNQVARATAP